MAKQASEIEQASEQILEPIIEEITRILNTDGPQRAVSHILQLLKQWHPDQHVSRVVSLDGHILDADEKICMFRYMTEKLVGMRDDIRASGTVHSSSTDAEAGTSNSGFYTDFEELYKKLSKEAKKEWQKQKKKFHKKTKHPTYFEFVCHVTWDAFNHCNFCGADTISTDNTCWICGQPFDGYSGEEFDPESCGDFVHQRTIGNAFPNDFVRYMHEEAGANVTQMTPIQIVDYLSETLADEGWTEDYLQWHELQTPSAPHVITDGAHPSSSLPSSSPESHQRLDRCVIAPKRIAMPTLNQWLSPEPEVPSVISDDEWLNSVQ